MHEETLAPKTMELFSKLSEESWISEFYLAGGTGLALGDSVAQLADLATTMEPSVSLGILVMAKESSGGSASI
jgi:hypothetical protein